MATAFYLSAIPFSAMRLASMGFRLFDGTKRAIKQHQDQLVGLAWANLDSRGSCYRLHKGLRFVGHTQFLDNDKPASLT